MSDLTDNICSLIWWLHKQYDGEREQIFKFMYAGRDEGVTEERINQTIDEFYEDMVMNIDRGFQHDLSKKDKEIQKLKQPFLELALPEKEFSESHSLRLIRKIEDSLIALFREDEDLFSDLTSKIDGVCLLLEPWFGYVTIMLRTENVDKNYKTNPDYWEYDNNTGLEILHDDHNKFNWLMDYMEKTHRQLHEENKTKLNGWNQWIRICAAAAITSSNFKEILMKHNNTFKEHDISSYCYKFYIPPGDCSPMNLEYNYVEYIFAKQIENQNISSIEWIDKEYSWCIQPIE